MARYWSAASATASWKSPNPSVANRYDHTELWSSRTRALRVLWTVPIRSARSRSEETVEMATTPRIIITTTRTATRVRIRARTERFAPRIAGRLARPPVSPAAAPPSTWSASTDPSEARAC